MSQLGFTKMNGWGNDFVVFDGPVEFEDHEIVRICDRRFGIGADGVLVVTAGEPVKMQYWNADGSPAEMCGNGLRCVARYASDRGLVTGGEFQVDTPVGPRNVRLHESEVEVELGPVAVTGHTKINDERYHLINVGNPHAVVEVEDPGLTDVASIGTAISAHSDFPEGTNVEFVRFADQELTMRVWERGVGETLACGTGMVAAAFVATKAVKMSTPITVHVPGGSGSVDFRDGIGWLRGPASYSFEGVWNRSSA